MSEAVSPNMVLADTERPPAPVIAAPPPAKVTPPPPDSKVVVAVTDRASAALLPNVRVDPKAEMSPKMLAALVTDNPPDPVIATPPESNTAPPPVKVEVAFTFNASAELLPRFKDEPRAERFSVTDRF